MKQQRVRRLALSYLAVIMTLSLVFSVIIYAVTSTQLNRELPPDDHIKQSADIEDQFHHRLERRDNETREMVVISFCVKWCDVGVWLLVESSVGAKNAGTN